MLTKKQLDAWNGAAERKLCRAKAGSPCGLYLYVSLLNGSDYKAARAAGKPLVGPSTAEWWLTDEELAGLNASPSRSQH
jgi:hypothetical protein